MILLLRKVEAADVEHAASAGTGVRRRCRQAGKQPERQNDCDEVRDRRSGVPGERAIARRRLSGLDMGRTPEPTVPVCCPPRRCRMTARARAGDEGRSEGKPEHSAPAAVRT